MASKRSSRHHSLWYTRIKTTSEQEPVSLFNPARTTFLSVSIYRNTLLALLTYWLRPEINLRMSTKSKTEIDHQWNVSDRQCIIFNSPKRICGQQDLNITELIYFRIWWIITIHLVNKHEVIKMVYLSFTSIRTRTLILYFENVNTRSWKLVHFTLTYLRKNILSIFYKLQSYASMCWISQNRFTKNAIRTFRILLRSKNIFLHNSWRRTKGFNKLWKWKHQNFSRIGIRSY